MDLKQSIPATWMHLLHYLYDYDNWWAISPQPHPSEFDYWEHLRSYYRALRARGVQSKAGFSNAHVGL